MLNVTSKSKNETFFITRIFESSRNVTSKVISNRIYARKPKSTEQYDCKLFFHLDGTCNSIVELPISTGCWDFESTIKFNASTGEEYCEWFVCGVWSCGTEVALNIKQAKAGWLRSFLSFLPETSKLQSAVYSEWMKVILPNISLLLNTLRQKNDLMKR